jgi:PEGA domain
VSTEGAVATIVLQVQPSSAQIFVDGEYVGTVDDVQSELTVAAGVHRVEFRAPGFDPIVVDVRVDAGRRITYRAALKPPA